MNYANRGQGMALSRSLLSVTARYRKVLLLVLMVLIVLGTVAVSASYLQLRSKVRELSALEPVKVMASAKELQVGDVLGEDTLVPMFLYLDEYESNKKSYVLDSEKQELIGRVVKVPLLARSFLRREHLAEAASLPGLVNLIEANHSLLDINVPQQGFNVFIRPDDRVDLYEIKDHHSELIAAQVKVILVDSEPIGKAPFRVSVDARQERQLTIAVQDSILQRALVAKQAGTLVATYRHKGQELAPKLMMPRKKINPLENLFQTLTMIKGSEREVLKQ